MVQFHQPVTHMSDRTRSKLIPYAPRRTTSLYNNRSTTSSNDNSDKSLLVLLQHGLRRGSSSSTIGFDSPCCTPKSKEPSSSSSSLFPVHASFRELMQRAAAVDTHYVPPTGSLEFVLQLDSNKQNNDNDDETDLLANAKDLEASSSSSLSRCTSEPSIASMTSSPEPKKAVRRGSLVQRGDGAVHTRSLLQ